VEATVYPRVAGGIFNAKRQFIAVQLLLRPGMTS
jgi:hypothetical protein